MFERNEKAAVPGIWLDTAAFLLQVQDLFVYIRMSMCLSFAGNRMSGVRLELSKYDHPFRSAGARTSCAHSYENENSFPSRYPEMTSVLPGQRGFEPVGKESVIDLRPSWF